MRVQHRQHDDGIISNKVEDSVLKDGQVHPADVGEADGIEECVGGKGVKTFANLGEKPFFKTGLLPPIPFGAVGKISLNERMKVERRHLCGRG